MNNLVITNLLLQPSDVNVAYAKQHCLRGHFETAVVDRLGFPAD